MSLVEIGPDKVVGRVLESLLVHLSVSNYFDVQSIFALRRVCRTTKRLVDSDLVWIALIHRWGLPSSPWLKSAHPCLSKLALFRDFCYLERQVTFKVPIESRYNDAYYCQIFRVGFRNSCVFVEFSVRGDMSLGPLQQPGSSRLDYVFRGNVVNRKRADNVMLLENENRTRYGGFMFFNIEFNRLLECDLYFQYGSGGYTIEKLCTLNRAFCRKNRLMHLSPETKRLY